MLLYIVFVHHVSLASNRVIVPFVAIALPSTDWAPQSERDKGPEKITDCGYMVGPDHGLSHITMLPLDGGLSLV